MKLSEEATIVFVAAKDALASAALEVNFAPEANLGVATDATGGMLQ